MAYIQSIPILGPDKKMAKQIEQLVNLCLSGAEDLASTDTDLDKLVYELYGLNPTEQALIQDWFRQRSISVVGDEDEDEDEDLEDEA